MNRHDYQATGAYLKCPRGEAQGHAKLTEADVRKIKWLHAKKQALVKRLNDKYSAQGLAVKFGVHARTIEKVLGHSSWVHV